LIEAGESVAKMMSGRIKAGIFEECHISASSGLAVFEQGLSFETLVGKADRKLYEDKARNKAQKAATKVP